MADTKTTPLMTLQEFLDQGPSKLKFETPPTVTDILRDGLTLVDATVTLTGTLTRFRAQKGRIFGHLGDGSGPTSIQFLYFEKEGTIDPVKVALLSDQGSAGASIRITGIIKESPAKGQDIELVLTDFKIIDIVRDPGTFQYGVQKKGIDYKIRLDTIRQDTHGRFRDPVQQAIIRVRSALEFAIYKFFVSQGFFKIAPPILTSSDCEGAGEMFGVTTLTLEDLPFGEDGEIDWSHDFFKKPANLTVSGQLEAEAMAQRMGKVFTFGPTFRAENSTTRRHLAEFWMMEPEMVFTDPDTLTRFSQLLDMEESMLKDVIRYVLDVCVDDMTFLDQTLSPGILDQMTGISDCDFIRMTYTEAIDILTQAVADGQVFEESIIEWGMDLASEHEKYIVDLHGVPVFLTHYPQDLKSFYMKADEGCSDDRRTCQAVDLLVPGIGELCGGSMREDDPDKLIGVMDKKDVPTDELAWYIDLRRDGGLPTGGFGLGFERLIRLVTGATNIRDVIPFPRFPGHI